MLEAAGDWNNVAIKSPYLKPLILNLKLGQVFSKTVHMPNLKYQVQSFDFVDDPAVF